MQHTTNEKGVEPENQKVSEIDVMSDDTRWRQRARERQN